MRLIKKCILGSNPIKIELPNFSQQRLIPKVLTFHLQVGEELLPAKDITCRVSGSTELCYMKEAYFQCSNVITLDRNDGVSTTLEIRAGSKASENNGRTVVVYIDYQSTDGIIVFQNTYDTFENVMKEVATSKPIYTLMLSFNKPVKGAQLIPLFEVESDGEDINWIAGLELGDTNEDNSYVIDFSGEDFQMYSSYLEYLTLKIDTEGECQKETPLKLYVLAYGPGK